MNKILAELHKTRDLLQDFGRAKEKVRVAERALANARKELKTVARALTATKMVSRKCREEAQDIINRRDS